MQRRSFFLLPREARLPMHSNTDMGVGSRQEARVFKDAFPLKISTHRASYNSWEEKNKTIFCTFRVEALTKLWVQSHRARTKPHKPTPQSDVNVCLSLQGIVCQEAAGLEQLETPAELWAGSMLLVAMHPRGQKILHVLSSDGRREKNAGKKAAMLGTLPAQAIRTWRTGASDFLYMRRKGLLLD